MRNIPLAIVPNQSVSVTVDNTRYVIRVFSVVGVMAVDIERNAVSILKGSRALAGEPLIPYAYLEEGNFIFVTVNDQLPDWREFGVSQQLVYLTAAEVEALK
jgi:hypothetical protein